MHRLAKSYYLIWIGLLVFSTACQPTKFKSQAVDTSRDTFEVDPDEPDTDLDPVISLAEVNSGAELMAVDANRTIQLSGSIGAPVNGGTVASSDNEINSGFWSILTSFFN